jgi:transposase
MIKWEIRVLLIHYLEQGLSKSRIARKLGLNRRTINRWIAAGHLEREVDTGQVPPPIRKGRPTKLEEFKPILDARLEKYPALSAVRLFKEAKAAGYTGGLTQLKLYVGQVRPQPEPEPIVRFETDPGHQAQVDFAEFTFPWGKRYALVVVLGYSRLLWLKFYPKQDMQTVFSGLEEAFAFFGGVPREILFDQMASVITKDLRDQGGTLVENAEFLRFAAHWGFRVRACRPYRAKTKGKVERPIRYVRGSFVYARDFVGDEDLNAQAMTWLTGTANVRKHRTTGERPIERLVRDEQALLLPLAIQPYRSLILPPRLASTKATGPAKIIPLPRISVERRPLDEYAAIAAGAL